MGEGRGGYIDLSTSTIPWPWVYYRTAKVSMSPVVRLKSIDGRMHEILSLGWVHSMQRGCACIGVKYSCDFTPLFV